MAKRTKRTKLPPSPESVDEEIDYEYDIGESHIYKLLFLVVSDLCRFMLIYADLC